MTRTFIDLHVLQTVPPSCINRDDTGSPKTATFGGVTRARVSSQAWKKATRDEFRREVNVDLDLVGERTLRVAERIAKRMRERDPELSVEQSQSAASAALEAAGIKVKLEKKKKGSDGEASEELRTGYLVFLSRAQIDALAEIGLEVARGEKADKRRAKQAFTDDNAVAVALFGRMIAEAPDLNVDAACQVSHALSVHAATPEFDYFTAVDDNADESNAGAGMIGTVEFVSATLYRYATIDAERLVENLGSKEAAISAVQAFIRAFLLSMPTGKQNTFANRTRPGLVLLEVRDDQPVNLSAAFEEPIASRGGVLSKAAERLLSRAVAEDEVYGVAPVRSAVLIADTAARERVAPILGRAREANLEELVALTTETLRERLREA